MSSVPSIDTAVGSPVANGVANLKPTLKPTAEKSKLIGSDPLDQPIFDGFYRIVQTNTETGESKDASFNIADLDPSTEQQDIPVLMSSTPSFASQFWKVTRQYGVKNGCTIVPVNMSSTDEDAIGATVVNKDGTVNVKRSHCYPIWNLECAEVVNFKENKIHKQLYYYRIREVGTDQCWKTDSQMAVTIAGTTKVGRPTNSELYQLVLANPRKTITVPSVETISVRASNADVVKHCYFGSEITAENLLRYISVQLVTCAHDQGWASDAERGLWSWFEIAIFSKAPAKGGLVSLDDIKKGVDGNPLTWVSHRVELDSAFSEQTGLEFAKDHELWNNLSAGEYIGVLACAQFSGWSCNARSGSLNFEELLGEEDA